MRLDDFDYALPDERIAQHPWNRATRRACWWTRGRRRRCTATSRDLGEFLRDGDLLVVNDSQGDPARLRLHAAHRRRGRGAAARAARRRAAHVGGDGAPGAEAAAGRGAAVAAACRWCGCCGAARPATRWSWSCSARATRWRCCSSTARCRCRRTSPPARPTRALPDRVRRTSPARRRRRRPGCTSRPSCSTQLGAPRRRDGARRAGRRARHVQAGQRRRPARPPDPQRALPRAAPTCWQRAATARRVVAVGTTSVRALESAATLGAAGGPHPAVHPPPVRVEGRRRADDQLPPAAHHAADDDRRVRRPPLARACTTTRSPRGTAS